MLVCTHAYGQSTHMKISEIIEHSSKPFLSLEIVPPLKGISKQELVGNIATLMEFNPPYINVTNHRDEFEFRQEADGSFSRHLVRRRVSETAVCAAIQEAFKVEVVPHIICGGCTAEEIKSQLEDFRFMGMSNVLALRGDSMLGEKRFTPQQGGYSYASELIAAIRADEQQAIADGKLGAADSFCIGVGAYPEKHFEAANLESDIANLKKKVDAGADYIITQMFFDNADFYAFRDKCRAAGINVPIIPGLKPLSTAKQLHQIPEAFYINIPVELTKELEAHSADKAACYQIGQQWCSAQCKDLLQHGVPAVHFYTMGKSANVIKVIRECF